MGMRTDADVGLCIKNLVNRFDIIQCILCQEALLAPKMASYERAICRSSCKY